MSAHERAHPRITSSISVNVILVTPEGRSLRAERIANISLGGVFIEMNDLPGFGTELTLEFKLTADRPAIRCKGFVVWTTKGKEVAAGERPGIGVRLTDLSVADMKTLKTFIETRLQRG